MKDGWKKALGIAGFGAVCYMGGHMNGSAPLGTEKPTTVMMGDLGETVGGVVHEGNQTAQTVLQEAGSMTATAGNAASGAGSSVQNTVPGAPPQSG